MQDLIKYAFDFFAHVLPGIVILLALSLFIEDINTLDDLQAITAKITTGVATVLVIVGYAIGFAIYPFGRWLYRSLGFKMFGKNVENKIDMFLSDKYVMIREKSPINFQYVESWNQYCAMSHNFAVASLVFFTLGIYKTIFSADKMLWCLVTICSLLMFFIFIYRAVRFYHWARHDLNSTVQFLRNDDDD